MSIGIGFAFAACVRPQAREGVSPWGRELAAVLSFAIFIRWPFATYLLLVHPDWSWLYVIDPARLPRSSAIILLTADLVAILGAFGGGWTLAHRGKDRIIAGAIAASGVLALALCFLLRRRLGAYATFGEFHAGHSLALNEVKLGWVLPACALGTAIAATGVGLTLWAHGRRAALTRLPPAPEQSGGQATPELSAPGPADSSISQS